MVAQHDGMTRRDILKGSIAMAATVVLAACGGAAPTATPAAGSAAGAASPSTASGTAKKGGTLKLSQPIPITPFEFQQLGPHIALVALGVFVVVLRVPRILRGYTGTPLAVGLLAFRTLTGGRGGRGGGGG